MSVTFTGPAVTGAVLVGAGVGVGESLAVAVAVGLGLGLTGPTSHTFILYVTVKPGALVPLADDVMVRQSVGSGGAWAVPPGFTDDVAAPWPAAVP
ncbi:MAG: hypothetical protein LBI49_04285 [Nocardiopsaceae bacterium]|nr:hypothetical protein [Nocardiopsaceae bacterium]